MRSNEPTRPQPAVLLARAYPGRTLLLLLVVGVGLYVLVTHLFPSETRKVRVAIDQVRSAIVQGDADKVLDRVSPYFFEEGVDKQALARYLKRVLADRPVRQLNIIPLQLQFQDDTATVDISVRSVQGRDRVPTDWTLVLEKLDGRWLLRRATPTQISGYPAMGLRALLHVQ